MVKGKEEKEKITKIAEHTQFKKKLTPPLLKIPFTNSSWINERLPEMLWAILIVGNFKREKALDFFRYVARYVEKNNEFADITHTSLGKIQDTKLEKFIEHLEAYSEEIKPLLQSLCIYNRLPKVEVWKKVLGISKVEEKEEMLYNAVLKTFDHQSQEATDCRWVKILCLALGNKLKFSDRDKADKILNYPIVGDMREIRPSIRAMEIGQAIMSSGDSNWSKNFWKDNYEMTDCIPEEVVSKKIEKLQEDLSLQIKNKREHYLKEIKKVRQDIINKFFEVGNSDLDLRKEAVFGLGLYGLVLFSEINIYTGTHSLTGRIALRSLIEIYISLEYLLKKEVTEPRIWTDFYEYGKGQSKLIYLKYKENNFNSSSVDLNEIELLLNEDTWLEFTEINLGQWGSTDLRKMSEEANIKEIYDKYYSYTSGYVHGTNFAIRESIYQRCLNPLHRFHRLPIFDLSLMPTVIPDSVEIVNKIIDCLSKAYPKISNHIDLYQEPKKSTS